MCIIYAMFTLDIISVPFPFHRYPYQRLKVFNCTNSGYCFVILVLVFAFMPVR